MKAQNSLVIMFVVSALFLPVIGAAQDLGSVMGPFDQLYFNLNFGRAALGVWGPSPSIDADDCAKAFLKEREKWSGEAERTGTLTQLSGYLDRSFTREEILHMPAENPRGLKGVIRGTGRLTRDPAIEAYAAQFPHAVQGCEKAFNEEVKVVRRDGKACRQVKMSLKDQPEAAYFQTYCENSRDLIINFHPKNLSRLTETAAVPCVR